MPNPCGMPNPWHFVYYEPRHAPSNTTWCCRWHSRSPTGLSTPTHTRLLACCRCPPPGRSHAQCQCPPANQPASMHAHTHASSQPRAVSTHEPHGANNGAADGEQVPPDSVSDSAHESAGCLCMYSCVCLQGRSASPDLKSYFKPISSHSCAAADLMPFLAVEALMLFL